MPYGELSDVAVFVLAVLGMYLTRPRRRHLSPLTCSNGRRGQITVTVIWQFSPRGDNFVCLVQVVILALATPGFDGRSLNVPATEMVGPHRAVGSPGLPGGEPFGG
jgi:hypothetical protein